MTDINRKALEIDAAWALHRQSDYPPVLMLRRQWMLQRYEEQNGLCAYCGDIMVVMTSDEVKARPDIAVLRATCDHVTPSALGGADDLENAVAACHGCNNIKGDIPPRIFVRWIQHGQARNLEPFAMRAYLALEAAGYRNRLSLHNAVYGKRNP